MKKSETTEQIQLFAWARNAESILPELKLLYHVPNEGKRTNGAVLKAAGLKSGVPDICLPVARNGFHGLYIELKFGTNKPTKAQRDFMELLKAQGYAAAVCYGAQEAGDTILEYLTPTGEMSKKACIDAAHYTDGTCGGVLNASALFMRKECRSCGRCRPSRAETTIKDILYPTSKRSASAFVRRSHITEEIISMIVHLSDGEPYLGRTMEDTLEIVNQDLALFARRGSLTVEQSAAVLTVAMDAYNAAKKARV